MVVLLAPLLFVLIKVYNILIVLKKNCKVVNIDQRGMFSYYIYLTLNGSFIVVIILIFSLDYAVLFGSFFPYLLLYVPVLILIFLFYIKSFFIFFLIFLLFFFNPPNFFFCDRRLLIWKSLHLNK